MGNRLLARWQAARLDRLRRETPSALGGGVGAQSLWHEGGLPTAFAGVLTRRQEACRDCPARRVSLGRGYLEARAHVCRQQWTWHLDFSRRQDADGDDR